MKVTVGRKKRGVAFLCVTALLVTSVLFPRVSKASAQEKWEYMQWLSLTYGAEAGTTDEYYVKVYDQGKNAPEYVLGIAATGTLPPNNAPVKIVRIADSVFRDKTFAKVYVETGSGMKIGANAFRGVCVQQITGNVTDHSVTFSGGTASEVGEYAFAEMNVKGDFTIDGVVGDIKAHAFENSTIDGKLIIKGQVDTVGEHAFAGVAIKGLSLPNIKKIGDYAFARTDFTAFQFGPYVESIGSRIFDECANLKKIVLPEEENLKEIAMDAFPNREGLTIVIPANIANYEIYHLEQYNNVTFQLPQDLSEDSELIRFMKDNHLKYIIGEPAETETPGPSAAPTPDGTKVPDTSSTEKPGTEPTIKPTAEPTGEPGTEPTIKPTGEPGTEPTVKPTGEPGTEPTKNPGSVSAGKSTPKPASSLPPGGAQTPTPSKGGKTAKSFQSKKVKYRITGNSKVSVVGYAGKTAKKLTIPNIVKKDGQLYKVTAIEKKAFRGFRKLQRVTVGNYVRTIGDEAFSNCSGLKRISFGTGIVSIGKKALYKDRKLKNIVFRGKHLKKIGKKTFYGVPKSVKIVVPKAKVKQYRKLVQGSRK